MGRWMMRVHESEIELGECAEVSCFCTFHQSYGSVKTVNQQVLYVLQVLDCRPCLKCRESLYLRCCPRKITLICFIFVFRGADVVVAWKIRLSQRPVCPSPSMGIGYLLWVVLILYNTRLPRTLDLYKA